jgi:hypothetical protein
MTAKTPEDCDRLFGEAVNRVANDGPEVQQAPAPRSEAKGTRREQSS